MTLTAPGPTPLLRWLGAAQECERELVGGKARSIDALARLGLRTPAGFCVSVGAWQRYVDENELAPDVEDLRRRLPDEDARVALQALATEHQLPLELHAEIVEAVASLDARDPGELLAVRSSAIEEDGEQTSYAGQHDTLLGVPPGEVEDAVRDCWASLWSQRAVAYRAEHARAQPPGGMGVVVQRLVPAEAAAVAFTIDPVDGSNDAVIINATPGLGDRLMSGEVSGDTFEIDRASLEPRPAGGDAGAGAASMGSDDAVELARIVLHVERAYGMPVDVEAAHAGGRWHLLQARPITSTE